MNLVQRVARHPTAYRWLVLRQRRLVELLERVLRWLSRGRVGVLDLAGLPSIQITAKGRRTGLARTSTVQYVPDGHNFLVVGSNWGRPTHPAWSANLQAANQVTVRQRSQIFTASVRMLAGPERKNAWEKILQFWPNYQIAQERALSREFRLFALTPIDAAGHEPSPSDR